MNIIESLSDYKNESPAVLTIGNFDGLHRGHQLLIEKVVSLSKIEPSKSYVLTFSPHPATVLSPTYEDNKILSRTEFCNKLNQFKIDNLIIYPFTRQTAKMTGAEFIDLLISKLNLKKLVIGYDFKFGKGKSTDFNFLKQYGEERGFEVYQQEPMKNDGKIISSSLIRKNLAEGKIIESTQMLGEYFFTQGQVEVGEGKGRAIGFPTINIRCNKKLFIKKGVYHTIAEIEGEKFNSVSNYGTAPTIKNSKFPVLETHLIDVDKNLYGKSVKLNFLNYIREEIRFNSVDSLVEQIKSDVCRAKTLNSSISEAHSNS